MPMKQLSADHYVFNVDPSQYTTLPSYRAQGGYSALEQALMVPPSHAIAQIKKSGLRGRGGAAFPAGTKLEMVRQCVDQTRYIICNADEGEPGTFKDRFIMTHLPYQLLEGITLAAYMAGATHGYIYVRHEYPESQKILRESIEAATAAGLLGNHILGSDFSLHLEIFSGAGSYLCGEETALLSSIEGRKGRPRVKPPYPTQSGLWGSPTLIHNVETLANFPKILANGADWFAGLGTEDSRGTKLISLSGDVTHRGIVEVPFGITFSEIIATYGGGTLPRRHIKAANIGGASGVLVPPHMLETPLEYKACSAAGITIGSGALFVLDDTRSIVANVQNRAKFFLHESCGKCTPCREGLRQINYILDALKYGHASRCDILALSRYASVLQDASFCGLGQAAGNSLISSLSYYRDEYEALCQPDDNTECLEVNVS
jgi:NADH:ubiquinone oxidoreductase subunit F (NADH-binding)